MIYAINYDLKQPGQRYKDLTDAIKGFGAWWHYLDSTWLVDSHHTASAIWQRLEPHVDTNDSVLVIGVTNDYQGWLPEDAWVWIRERNSQMAS